MAIIKSNGSGLKGVSITDPRVVFQDLLKTASGTAVGRTVRYNIFYQLIAFHGVKDGIGTSTLVANTALAMAKLGLNVCVIDTSIINPCQDYLLKSNTLKIEEKKKVGDWFDMGYVRKSVLNTSTIDKRISILSFENRNIIDLLSTMDNASAVELAFTQLCTKFDIILIDVCSETTNITTTCLQLAHKVIQVWSNAEPVMRNIENFIRNNTICSCPLDKMRNVVTSMCVDSITTNWDALIGKFKAKHLAHSCMSMRLAEKMASGHMIFGAADKDISVQMYNDCITDIVCHLLDINAETGKSNVNFDDNLLIDGKGNAPEAGSSSEDFPETTVELDEGVSLDDLQPEEPAYENSGEFTQDYADTGFNEAISEEPVKKGFFKRRGK